MVIGRYDIENLMRLHPASAYLPSSVRYPNSENYASDGRDYEKEISDLLLNLRPIKRVFNDLRPFHVNKCRLRTLDSLLWSF